MRYAVLCFTADELVNGAWSQDDDDEMMTRLAAVQREFEGTVLWSARLLPPSSAVAVRRSGGGSIVLDGPFIESKEQFMGYYMVECDGLDPAVRFAERLAEVNPWGSGYEIRPVAPSVVDGLSPG